MSPNSPPGTRSSWALLISSLKQPWLDGIIMEIGLGTSPTRDGKAPLGHLVPISIIWDLVLLHKDNMGTFGFCSVLITSNTGRPEPLFPSYRVACRGYLRSAQDITKTFFKAMWAWRYQLSSAPEDSNTGGPSWSMIFQGRLCACALQVAIPKPTWYTKIRFSQL